MWQDLLKSARDAFYPRIKIITEAVVQTNNLPFLTLYTAHSSIWIIRYVKIIKPFLHVSRHEVSR
jgi:hypothetical protein